MIYPSVMNQVKKIALFGSGFVGSNLANALLSSGYQVRLVSRQPDSDDDQVELVAGNIVTGESLSEAVNSADAVINAVGIIEESGKNSFDAVHHQGVVNLIDACRKNNVDRFVLISALGVGIHHGIDYFDSKYKGEQALIDSGLNFVIFRPSTIFGPGDGFVSMLAKYIKPAPAFPVFGDGGYKMQPVSVHNLADAVAQSVTPGKWDNKIYSACGPRQYEYIDIIKMIADALNRKILIPKIPFGLVLPIIKFADSLNIPTPATADQLKMLRLGSVCPDNEFQRDFELDLKDFEAGIREYLR
ncbi:MAG: NAD(P)H-binding protein [candidate division Zixibacteria bacterium]|nr:NAD(P)H-binding protein [candidate division Zixibacteria bacterium]